MATIVNNPPPQDSRLVVDRGSDTAGWVIAIILLLIVLGVFWYHYARPVAPATSGTAPSASVNVTLPGTTGGGGGATGGSGGATGGGSTGGTGGGTSGGATTP